ncbi:uncharacterized protein LOC134537437 isoform X5 [Bacillus rossius redtenbacheri]|uniref:uncharacterized protein LOC134537437 isoform X5 n=1 Tax=Bacillus rossius redtenbacheri TaxID=93214 RepID=UPI002FDD1CE2
MELLHAECEGIKQKYRQLQLEWSSQQEHLGKMQSELYRLRGQIQLQSQFCASLGSVTGNLLWKCSRLPPVIDLLLSGNKLVDFLSLVSGSLQSFLETYGGDLPPTGSDECQFIMSLCGIVTNVAAAAAGRQFLATSERGRELLGQVVAVLPRIPVPAGNCFKRYLRASGESGEMHAVTVGRQVAADDAVQREHQPVRAGVPAGEPAAAGGPEPRPAARHLARAQGHGPARAAVAVLGGQGQRPAPADGAAAAAVADRGPVARWLRGRAQHRPGRAGPAGGGPRDPRAAQAVGRRAGQPLRPPRARVHPAHQHHQQVALLSRPLLASPVVPD